MSELRAILGEIWEPGKWIALPAAYVGLIGLIFSIFLSAEIGFKVDTALAISDYFSIGLLLLMRFFWWSIIIMAAISLGTLGYWLFRRKRMLRHKEKIESEINELKEKIKRLDKSIKETGKDQVAVRSLQKQKMELVGRIGSIKNQEKKTNDEAKEKIETAKQSALSSKKIGISAVTLGVVLYGILFSFVEVGAYTNAIRDYATSSMHGTAPKELRNQSTDRSFLQWVRFLLTEILETFDNRVEDITKYVEDYSLKPRLVSIGTEKANYRPMILVTEFSGELVLYDFIYDDVRDDGRIYPIRTIRKSDVTNVSAVSPARKGQEQGFAPIVDLIISRCPGATAPDGKLTTFLAKYISGDFIVCPPALPPDDELLTAVRELEEEISALISRDGAMTTVVKDISATLNSISTNGIRIATRSENPAHDQARILFQNFRSYFLLSDDEAGGGRWSKCKLLTAWNAPEYRIEFVNNESLLNERGAHRLQFTPPRAGEGSAPVPGENPWDVLLRLLETWMKEVEAYQAQNPGEGAVLFLIGQASENGNVAHNLRLTERRAEGVRKILVRQFAERLKGARLHPFERGYVEDKYAIIAIGEGESAMAPESFLASTENRRVDARLCFLDPEIGTARAPDANTSPGE